MKSRRIRAILAGALVVISLVLFDYCRYVIAHHPTYDLARLLSLGIQGMIVSVNFLAMLKLLDSLAPRA